MIEQVTILFLDIDGVCHNTISEEVFSPFNMNNLRMVCEHINPKIVLSSDWRRSTKHVSRARAEIGVVWPIFDFTPIKLSLNHRKDEIRMWLSENTWHKALILDDMDAFECDPVMENVTFFQTDRTIGLSEDDVDAIVRMFPKGVL